jgi:DNA-binding response OmpR family regulator
METNQALLCIYRDPAQLNLLAQSGYELLTVSNGHEGLRLFMSRSVDAIVLDYQLGLLNGGVVAAEIKKVKPQVPIVMFADSGNLPDEALKAVDALVAKSEGPQSLLATIRSLLNGNLALPERKLEPQMPLRRGRTRKAKKRAEPQQANAFPQSADDKAVPFSPQDWQSVRKGTFRF